MKKLICAAIVAGSMMVMAEEPAKPAEAAPAASPVLEAQPQPPRMKLTEEQKQKMREQREKFMAERKAATEARMLEVAKKYGFEGEKAKELVKDMQEAMKPPRRQRPQKRAKPKTLPVSPDAKPLPPPDDKPDMPK